MTAISCAPAGGLLVVVLHGATTDEWLRRASNPHCNKALTSRSPSMSRSSVLPVSCDVRDPYLHWGFRRAKTWSLLASALAATTRNCISASLPQVRINSTIPSSRRTLFKMWARTLRSRALPAHRTVLFSRLPKRHYNGQQHQGPHTTYFQTPPEPPKPRRRILRSLFLGTTVFFVGAYTHAWLYDLPMFGIGLSEEDLLALEEGSPFQPEGQESLMRALAAAAQDTAAREVPAMDLERAQEFLQLRAGYSVTPTAVGHSCQLPSNLPCEDTEHAGAYTLFNDPAREWCTWSIWDGHAGPRTSQLLQQSLPSILGQQLWEAGCMKRAYMPNDWHIVQTIKKAFKLVDGEILREAEGAVRMGTSLAHSVAIMSPALSGSCALVTLFDPQNSVLRVANTGDSRAVLGRWDAAEGKYIAKPMSVDQTGFNPDEVERLKREHPDEDPVDPNTGRVFGIAISRAFGDARWKWPEDLTQTIHEKFWGPAPRPNGVIKTPPYLTAEPEVLETKVQAGAKPDFLIMASDGLWDNMSNEDAVTCVNQWLDKFKPDAFLAEQQAVGKGFLASLLDTFRRSKPTSTPFSSNNKDKFLDAASPDEDDETYWDANEKAMKWKVSPKHFVVEDDHAGVHLIKNALGGRRRSLYCGIMSIQPPLSRNVRDDITVQVIFFGVDGSKALGK